MRALPPISRREQRTLAIITSCRANSRLACQARERGNGDVVELPPGMYVNSLKDIESLIGRRAEQDLLHPLTGAVLVEQGKLITRSMMRQIENGENLNLNDYFKHSR